METFRRTRRGHDTLRGFSFIFCCNTSLNSLSVSRQVMFLASPLISNRLSKVDIFRKTVEEAELHMIQKMTRRALHYG